jgi:hypothetical protein
LQLNGKNSSNPLAGTDGRIAAVLQAGERDFVLSGMRGLLSAHELIGEQSYGTVCGIFEEGDELFH